MPQLYTFIILSVIRILISLVFVLFKNVLTSQRIPTVVLIYYVYHEWLLRTIIMKGILFKYIQILRDGPMLYHFIMKKNLPISMSSYKGQKEKRNIRTDREILSFSGLLYFL